LAQRPRFSWEAAYLATLLIFGLFGAPLSPAHEAGSRLLASLQEPDGLIAKADSSLKRWGQETELFVDACGHAKETLGRMKTRSADTAETLIGQGRCFLQQSEEYMVSAGKFAQEKTAAVYRGLKDRSRR
jgi:hypothetical protein